MFHSEKGLSHKSDDLRSISSIRAGAGHGDACPWLQLWGSRKKNPRGLLATRLGESVPRSARCGSSENKVGKWLKWHLASVCTRTHAREHTCTRIHVRAYTHRENMNEWESVLVSVQEKHSVKEVEDNITSQRKSSIQCTVNLPLSMKNILQ